MKKILTIGGATQDMFAHFESTDIELLEKANNRLFLLFEEGTKVEIDQLNYASGGGATNSAVGLKQLGYEVATVCKVATDNAGDYVLKDLHKFGIDTSMTVTTNAGTTGVSFIIPAPSGNRVIFVHRGVNGTLTEQEIPLKKLHTYDGLYITSLAGATATLLPLIVQHAQKNRTTKKPLIANNPGKGQLTGDIGALENALKNIDIFILNAHEARVLLETLSAASKECTKRLLALKPYHESAPCPDLLKNLVTLQEKCLDIRHFFKEILRHGPKIVVVTNGAEGVYAATQKKIYFHKALPIEVVNSVGAGDSFGSCFFGSLLDGRAIEEALAFGTITSSSVLSTPTAKKGFLSFEELEQRKKKLPANYLQAFDW